MTNCYCATRGCRIRSRGRACFPFRGHAADRRRAVHTHAANTDIQVVFILYFSIFFSQKLYGGCGDDDYVCFRQEQRNARAEESTTGLDFGWLVFWWCSAPEPTNAIVTPTIIIGTRRGRWRIHPTAVPRDARDLAGSDPPARPPSRRRRYDGGVMYLRARRPQPVYADGRKTRSCTRSRLALP